MTAISRTPKPETRKRLRIQTVLALTLAALLATFCPHIPVTAAEVEVPAADDVEIPAEAEIPVEISPEVMRELLKGIAGSEAQPGFGSAELDLADLKNRYQNALVKIEFTMIGNVVETKFNPTKSEDYYAGDEPPHGTGFFISQTDILTNAHVVEEARRGSIRIKSPATGNVEFKADVLGIAWSESIDLAVLRMPADEVARFKRRASLETIPALSFGDSREVKQADALAIFGYPQSSDELKIIQCKVTGRQYLKMEFDEFVCGHQFIEVGPAGVVQPGNSGGPALNAAGEVVGIPARGSGWAFEQGWLIPSDVATHFLDQIYKSDEGKKAIRIPQLGISLTENFPGTAVWSGVPEEMVIFEVGVVVRDVIPNSLAAQWGLKPNDIILGFANKQREISAAIDFEGYRVTTGKMATWPPDEQPDTTPEASAEDEAPKTHLNELVMMSEPGDEVALWYVRPGEEGIQKIERKMEYQPPVKLPHLGVFDKPPFELWGDFVAQDFNDFNARLFDVPAEEILGGGVLVTFTEPNSLASRRGMELMWREPFGFSISMRGGMPTQWVIIESLNGEPVRNLSALRKALRAAERRFEKRKEQPDYDAKRKSLMKERYAQVGFRTNRTDGTVLHLTPAFPIDEALETRPDSLPLLEE